MPQPGLALVLFLLGAGALVLLAWPRWGIVARLLRVVRLTERVRVEDALKHLIHCESMGLPCTTESVAGALEISQARTVQLLTRLKRLGLSGPDGQGHRLTEEGRNYALRLLRTHRLLEKYFADRTGVPAEEWHERAEREEHLLSEAETERLASRMGHPLYDPHGDPIPSAAGVLPAPVGIPLPGVDEGTLVRITHLEDEPREIYDRLVARGFAPGMTLRVLESGPSRVRFVTDGREEVLDGILAANVEVVAHSGPAPEPEQHHPTLADTALGGEVEVVDLAPTCQGPQRRRLLDLGVVPGTRIRAVMSSATGDPIAYDIRGAMIALRSRQAAQILVRPAADSEGAAA